jgi:hypothetical protein
MKQGRMMKQRSNEMYKPLSRVVGFILVTAFVLSGCIGGMTRSAEIKSGSYVRINRIDVEATPIAVGVNGVVIDRDRRQVTFTLADSSEVTAPLTAEASKWADGCPTNLYSTRMEMLYLAENELTLESVTFRRPVIVANCPVPPLVITLQEAGDETEASPDASACQWWAGAKCIYFGQDYATLRGQIVDFETREPIQDAEAVFVAPTGSQIYPATFQVILPGGAQVRLEVSAPGYAPSVGKIEIHGDKVVVSHGPGPLSEGAPFELLDLRDPRQPVEFQYYLERAK